MSKLSSLVRPRIVVALLLVAGVVWGGSVLLRDTQSTEITAYFSSTEGLYVGDDVKVLGVRVGEVTQVTSEGDRVKVRLKVDAGQPIPVGARAAIVAPSLVSGRFIQLEPAWDGGKRMQDGDTIAQQDTAIPVSFDDVKRQLTDLTQVLGPQDADGKAPLAEAVKTLQRNLRAGNATELRASIAGLRAAAEDLSGNRSDLFATISNLNAFTRNLAVNDAAVRGFTEELASVSGVLSNNRTQLTGALRELRIALRATDGFLGDNRAALRTTTRNAADLTATLADRSNELAGILHLAPHAVIDLNNIIENQAITGRATLSGLDSVAQLVCGAILGVGGAEKACLGALQPLLGVTGLLNPLTGSPDKNPPPAGSGAPKQPDRPGLLDGLIGDKGLLAALLGGGR
ncbi:MCE family protein [Nocardioides daejeonensis]|uniref:MCE family protein n=1 Tax=Nocardioides daejeonensis TaxID=1046556 RepID=UPI000D742A04|nr:MCE family protein [Nocardioides daejeonensis]